MDAEEAGQVNLPSQRGTRTRCVRRPASTPARVGVHAVMTIAARREWAPVLLKAGWIAARFGLPHSRAACRWPP